MDSLGAAPIPSQSESGSEQLGPTHTDPLDGRWPHALSHEPTLRVSEVLALVGNEFPALTASKLRFLDSQGLVCPVRTGGGYRHYSPADVERLRFVLREQRDRFRPLEVIAEDLARLDAGEESQEFHPRQVAKETSPYVSVRELAELSGADAAFVELVIEHGFIAPRVRDTFPASDVAVVEAAWRFRRAGGDLRELRVLRNAAEREARSALALGESSPYSTERIGIIQERAEAAAHAFLALIRRATDG